MMSAHPGSCRSVFIDSDYTDTSVFASGRTYVLLRRVRVLLTSYLSHLGPEPY